MTDEGASPRELLLEACRRNNLDLLHELLHKLPNPHEAAAFLNQSKDALGAFALHVAAQYGSYDVLDELLDQEGLEVDPVDRMEGDTPLHKAVRYVNDLPPKHWEEGHALVELLLDAGADPKIRNKAKLKPVELVDPRNKELRQAFQKAEFVNLAGNDIVNLDAQEEEEQRNGAGSASDSE